MLETLKRPGVVEGVGVTTAVAAEIALLAYEQYPESFILGFLLLFYGAVRMNGRHN